MLPVDIILSTDADEQYNELTRMYEDLARAINGKEDTWKPTIEGADSGAAGTGSYDTQLGYYYRRGLLVDCWFALKVTAHTGTGNARIKLPYKIKKTTAKGSGESDIWVGVVLDSSLTYPSGTALKLCGLNNTYYLEIVACDAAGVSAIVQIDDDQIFSISGSIRYIGQADT